MMIIEIYGHILIMTISIPIIGFLAANLRKKRIEQLLLMTIDKMKTDIDAAIHILSIQKEMINARITQTEDAILIGYVNLHAVECQDSECPCKKETDIYDVRAMKFSERNVGFHKDYIFLYNLNRQLYENALNKFINSPRLHIDFSFFLYHSMKNFHASLVNLNIAEKKKPSIYQQFTIFRAKDIVENSIKQENTKGKDMYQHLTNVIEFERLLMECQTVIERVCACQIEFWGQLNTHVPDMNILYDLAKKIFDGTKEGEEYWNKLCKINSNYPRALRMYGEYLSLVKNNEQLGYELIDREKMNMNKKSLDEMMKNSNVLFAHDTVVIHISGNKDSPGKILKTNDKLHKVLGYNKSEVINHLINILMPNLFARRHNEFLSLFFRTGRKPMFNHESLLYAVDKEGFCFQMKLVIKQLPDLSEGIQYVGMIRQSHRDYEYILTDMNGIIDSFSKGVNTTLTLSPKTFKDSEINIQILAPDLIKVFSSVDKKRTLLEKFKEPGGQKISFYFPKDLEVNTKVNQRKREKDPKSSKEDKSEVKGESTINEVLYRRFNKDINKNGGVANNLVSSQELLKSPEYKECGKKQNVRCEIQDLVFGDSYKKFEPLKLRVFKISGMRGPHIRGDGEFSSSPSETFIASHSGASFDFRDQKSEAVSSRCDIVNYKEESKNIIKYFNQSKRLMGNVKKKEEKEEEKEEEKKEIKTHCEITEQIPGFVTTTENRVETVEEHPLDTLKAQHPKKATEGAEQLKDNEESKQDNSPKEKQAENPISDIGFKEKVGKLENEEEKKGKRTLRTISSGSKNNEIQDNKPEGERNPFACTIGESDHLSHVEEQKDDNEGGIRFLTKEKISDMKKAKGKKMYNVFTDNQKSLDFSQEEENKQNKTINDKLTPMLKLKENNEDKGSKTSEKKSIELAKKNSRDNRGLAIDKRVLKQRRKKMFSKIVTNLKFEEGDDKFQEIPDYVQEADEMKLRRALQAHERKQKQKEKRKQKKVKKKQSENESESESEKNDEEKNEEESKEEEEEQEEGESQDTQSSVTSGSTGSTARSFYSLRAAIDEKFTPPSIKMLKCTANIVFLLVMSVAVVYFVIQVVIFSKIKKNIKNIRYSENRYNYALQLDQSLIKLIFLNINKNEGNPITSIFADYEGDLDLAFDSIREDLRGAATSLKNTQTELSSRTANDDLRNEINPEGVELLYKHVEGMPIGYNYTVWQAIMEIVVSSFKISNMKVEQINEGDNPTVYFIRINVLNELLLNLDKSSLAIIDNIRSSKDTNVFVFILLLCGGSLAVLISVAVLMPIIRKVKMNKQDVLKLLMIVKKENIDEEINKCKRFHSSIKPTHEAEASIIDNEEEKDESPENGRKEKKELEQGGRRKKKPFKELAIGLGMVAFQFSLILLIMEGYFLLTYFLSTTFLSQVISLTRELTQLISRLPSHSLFLLVVQ